MKKTFLFLFILLSFSIFGQDAEEQIKKINTVEEAKEFIIGHSNIESKILVVTPEIENTEVEEIFLNKKTGDIFSKNKNTFKIIDSKSVYALRVSYIYLDGNKLSMESINDQRNKILKEYKSGSEFSALAKKYTMDNSLNGDIGWFTEGMMVKEFETAIKNHKLNDIFTIDIPNEKWYYVTLKTFEEKEVQELTVLQIKN